MALFSFQRPQPQQQNPQPQQQQQILQYPPQQAQRQQQIMQKPATQPAQQSKNNNFNRPLPDGIRLEPYDPKNFRLPSTDTQPQQESAPAQQPQQPFQTMPPALPVPSALLATPSSLPAAPSSLPAAPSSLPAAPSSLPAAPSSLPAVQIPEQQDAVPQNTEDNIHYDKFCEFIQNERNASVFYKNLRSFIGANEGLDGIIKDCEESRVELAKLLKRLTGKDYTPEERDIASVTSSYGLKIAMKEESRAAKNILNISQAVQDKEVSQSLMVMALKKQANVLMLIANDQ